MKLIWNTVKKRKRKKEMESEGNKQYHFTLPYIYYWGTKGYHFIQFHKHSWKSILGNRINGNVFFTILLEKGKLKFIKGDKI